MNWLDIGIIILLAVPAIIGLWVGIIKTVFFLAGLVVGVILAGRFSEMVSGWLGFIRQPQAARIVAFILIIVVVILAALILAAIMKRVLSVLMLGWINRLLGAGLGFIIGAIFCGAVLAIWVKVFGVSGPVADSALAKLLLDRFPIVMALLPGDFGSIKQFFR